jgi:RalA-binding protein 1
LPEPVLTSELLARFEEAGAEKEVATRESELHNLIMQLPACNRQLLAWLMLHLENITVHVSLSIKKKVTGCGGP